jgi:hypothetical protein
MSYDLRLTIVLAITVFAGWAWGYCQCWLKHSQSFREARRRAERYRADEERWNRWQSVLNDGDEF